MTLKWVTPERSLATGTAPGLTVTWKSQITDGREDTSPLDMWNGIFYLLPVILLVIFVASFISATIRTIQTEYANCSISPGVSNPGKLRLIVAVLLHLLWWVTLLQLLPEMLLDVIFAVYANTRILPAPSRLKWWLFSSRGWLERTVFGKSFLLDLSQIFPLT